MSYREIVWEVSENLYSELIWAQKELSCMRICIDSNQFIFGISGTDPASEKFRGICRMAGSKISDLG